MQHTIAPHDFSFIQDLMRTETAIVVDTGKEYLVESRLSPIVRGEGLGSITELIGLIRAGAHSSVPVLRRRVIEALTTNETSFYRDLDSYEVLRNTVLPELISKRAAQRTLSLWCAATATGQEPYSVCMLLREHFPQLASWKIDILATDINREALQKARDGVYTQFEINRGLPVTHLIKYFQKKGTDWQIKDTIRSMVKFEELNLVKPWPSMPNFDIVMIRNVLIYFDLPVKRDILARVRRLLAQDGYLFLGAAETTLNVDERFERRSLPRGSYFFLR